jgi:hypothetical protein
MTKVKESIRTHRRARTRKQFRKPTGQLLINKALYFREAPILRKLRDSFRAAHNPTTTANLKSFTMLNECIGDFSPTDMKNQQSAAQPKADVKLQGL